MRKNNNTKNSSTLEELWKKLSWRLSVTFIPLGADVYIRGYSAKRDTWRQLRKTPLEDVRIPQVVLYWKAEHPRCQPYETVGIFLYSIPIKTRRFLLEDKETLRSFNMERRHFPRVKVPVLMINGKYDYDFMLATEQKTLFDLLGTKAKDKEHFVLESGHNLFAAHRQQATKKVLEWLDR